jgi:hypothetical protein
VKTLITGGVYYPAFLDKYMPYMDDLDAGGGPSLHAQLAKGYDVGLLDARKPTWILPNDR